MIRRKAAPVKIVIQRLVQIRLSTASSSYVNEAERLRKNAVAYTTSARERREDRYFHHHERMKEPSPSPPPPLQLIGESGMTAFVESLCDADDNLEKSEQPSSLHTKILEHNSTLSDVEVAERVRWALKSAVYKVRRESGQVSQLRNTLPLSVLAKILRWHTCKGTSTRNLRKFLSYFPDHFHLLVVGEKDIWARLSPKDGFACLPSSVPSPYACFGSLHTYARKQWEIQDKQFADFPQTSFIPIVPPLLPRTERGVRQGDLNLFAQVVQLLRPVVHLEILVGVLKSHQICEHIQSSFLMRELSPDFLSVLSLSSVMHFCGSQTSTMSGFSIAEAAKKLQSRPEKLRESLKLLPPDFVTVSSRSFVSSVDVTGCEVEHGETDDSDIILLGPAIYCLEVIRMQLTPKNVVASAITKGLPLIKQLLESRSLEEPSFDAILSKATSSAKSIASKSTLSDPKLARSVVFDLLLMPSLRLPFESQTFDSSFRTLSQSTLDDIEKKLQKGKTKVTAVLDCRGLELLVGWRSSEPGESTLQKMLQCGSLSSLIGEHFLEDKINRVVLDKNSHGNERLVVIGLAASSDDSQRVTKRSTLVDRAMAMLFCKRIDQRLASLTNSPPEYNSSHVIIHNNSHSGLDRFEKVSDLLPPESPVTSSPPPAESAANAAPPPPPPPRLVSYSAVAVGNISPLSSSSPLQSAGTSQSYYYGANIPFEQLLRDAKRRCIPARRYFEPLLLFIADVARALFDVVLPALDPSQSGGANRMERFAQVSGFSSRCQHKVGSIETFLLFFDGIFVETMGMDATVEHRGEGYVREYLGRVTRRMLYTRFFLPLLSEITAAVDTSTMPVSAIPPRASPRNHPPPPPPSASKVPVAGVSPVPVPAAQQGISVSDIAAACHYDQRFEGRFGPLAGLLLDFNDFLLMPTELPATDDSNSYGSQSMKRDYRAQYILPATAVSPPLITFTAADSTGKVFPSSTLDEMRACRVVLDFVDRLRQTQHKANNSFYFVSLAVFMELLKNEVHISSIFESMVILLPSTYKSLKPYIDAASERRGSLPPPSFNMCKQTIEALCALFPLHFTFVFSSGAEAGPPLGIQVSSESTPLPPAWISYMRTYAWPIIVDSKKSGTDISVSGSYLEIGLQWRSDPRKPFPSLPFARSHVNRTATIPLYPLLVRVVESSRNTNEISEPLFLQIIPIKFLEISSNEADFELRIHSDSTSSTLFVCSESMILLANGISPDPHRNFTSQLGKTEFMKQGDGGRWYYDPPKTTAILSPLERRNLLQNMQAQSSDQHENLFGRLPTFFDAWCASQETSLLRNGECEYLEGFFQAPLVIVRLFVATLPCAPISVSCLSELLHAEIQLITDIVFSLVAYEKCTHKVSTIAFQVTHDRQDMLVWRTNP